ncbi:response regulator [Wukongibacter sp. M2B1]|uniref:response regulator n=1 Tax=Wukongibacter sp. M2B1 TaxID=3088895 RepID=UPI003D798609
MGVLIVDDAAFMRMTIKNILEKNNIEVLGEAVSGKDALVKYRLLKPDIVTMDLTMPELDGIRAIKEITKMDSEAKIIVCSAMGQEPKVIEAITAGAKSFVVKPINEKRLIDEIKRFF